MSRELKIKAINKGTQGVVRIKHIQVGRSEIDSLTGIRVTKDWLSSIKERNTELQQSQDSARWL